MATGLVRKTVSKICLRGGAGCVDNSAEFSAAVFFDGAKRERSNMAQELFPDVGSNPECAKMRTHQRSNVDQNRKYCKSTALQP